MVVTSSETAGVSVVETVDTLVMSISLADIAVGAGPVAVACIELIDLVASRTCNCLHPLH